MTQRRRAGADQPVEAAIAGPTPVETATDLRALRERLQQERNETLAAAEAAERFEKDHILDVSDDALDENAASIIRLRRQVRRLEERERQVGLKLEAAEQAEREAGRIYRRQEALAAIAEGEAWVRGPYAAAAEVIATGLARLVEIKALVDEIDRDRPDGAPWLEVEAFRALAGTPDSVTRQAGPGHFVDEAGSRVEGDQVSRDAAGQYWLGQSRVFRQEDEVEVRVPGRPRATPTALPSAVRLPRVHYADPDFWPRRSEAWTLAAGT